MNAAAERSAADVEKPVLRLKAVIDQKLELQLPDFIPQPADHFAVPALGNLGCNKRPAVVATIVSIAATTGEALTKHVPSGDQVLDGWYSHYNMPKHGQLQQIWGPV